MEIIYLLRKKLWMFLLVLPVSIHAQVITLSGPTTGEYTSNQSITLLPGFSTSGPFHAYITSTLNVNLGSAPSQNQNYITTNTFKQSGYYNVSQLPNPTINQVSQVIQYMDGLGRPVQMVQTKGSPFANDIVQPIVYDAYGRESQKYLPYTEQTGNGSYKALAINAQLQFYGASGWDAAVAKTSAPYSQALFDASPLNRVTEMGAPGTVWQPAGSRTTTSGRTVLQAYGTNNASTDYGNTGYNVNLWTAVPVTGATYKRNLVYNGSYGSGQLYLNVVKDENWTSADGKERTTEEYTDKSGRIVLKRTFYLSGATLQELSTYYVYDDQGNLSFVLPPGASPDGTTISQTTIDQFCYEYRYDGRNRLIEKKTPGKGWDYLVYNKLDQPVLSQDSVQRIQGQWVFNKYDGPGRVIATGLYSSNAARTSLETTLNGETTLWEASQTTGIGYTSLAFPQTVASYLNIQYYDDYTFPGASNYPYTASVNTGGLLTGRQAAVLGTGTLLLSVNYYDDQGRLSKIYKQHYQSGAVNTGNYDEVSNNYNFEGALTASTRIHHNVNSGNTTIASRYEYDHVGRPLKTYETINADPEVLLSENIYNEVGQLKTTKLGNGLQSTSYAYNERGWLKGSTSDQFSFQLNYQDGSSPQYNGNISGQLWGSGNTLGSSFNYTYDKLNRLVSGIGTGMSETMTYDQMGNIQSMNRDGTTRNYLYTGNRLTSTSGAPGSGTYQYDGNGNAVYDGRIGQSITYNVLNLPSTVTGQSLSYTYDATGNKLKKISGNTVTDYIDGIVYSGGAIQFIQTEQGIARKNGTSYSYEYNLTDHLGNVRYTFYKNPSSGQLERLQSDDYYPFGLRKSGSPVSLNNKYLYNGKELQDELNTAGGEGGQYDYGFRFYDPVIGRWNVVDPMAGKHPSSTPYNYTFNNPVNLIDPLGLDTLPANHLVDDGRGSTRPMRPDDVFTLPEVKIHGTSKSEEAYNVVVAEVQDNYERSVGGLNMGYPDRLKSDAADIFHERYIAHNEINPFSGEGRVVGLQDANWIVDMAAGGLYGLAETSGEALIAEEMLNPGDIHFMQSSIKNQTGEFTVLGNAEALRAGTLDPGILKINIWKDASGKIWTLDHRRLAAFRLSELQDVPVQWASPEGQMWKMTTTNGGTSIFLKLGGGNGMIVK